MTGAFTLYAVGLLSAVIGISSAVTDISDTMSKAPLFRCQVNEADNAPVKNFDVYAFSFSRSAEPAGSVIVSGFVIDWAGADFPKASTTASNGDPKNELPVASLGSGLFAFRFAPILPAKILEPFSFHADGLLRNSDFGGVCRGVSSKDRKQP
jgi:hypothetical protein